MIVTVLLQLLWGLGVRSEPPFNNPPGVDIWCGKAYRASDPSFDPGGLIFPPEERNKLPKLELVIYPRYNLYLSSDKTGSFILSTVVSTLRGQNFKNETWYPERPQTKAPFTELRLIIYDDAIEHNRTKIVDTWIPVNATDIEVPFSLSGMEPSQERPSRFVVYANSPDAIQTYYSAVSVNILPERNDTGSVSRVDALYGGLSVKSSLTKNTWKDVFPYSFYTSWDWISSTLTNTSSPKTLSTFRAQGYNLIHPVPPGGTDPFNHTLLSQFLTLCDELELYVMYDMRHTYQNTSSITAQLSLLTHHPSLLLYYTADEPDGWCDPLNATQLSYKHIHSIDPYHPVSLVLNCANFYFEAYTKGADIILEDTYPIAVNTSFSTVYHTPCNATYGDCGCDNCHVNDAAYAPVYTHNAFLDIIDRTENLYAYQGWQASRSVPKPVWGVPQAFWDEGSFWDRWPSAAEEAVMGVLRLNHGAKGIVAWIYPTSAEVERVTASLATVVASGDVTRFLLGAKRIGGLRVVGGDGLLDGSAWERGGEMLVSLVYLGYGDVDGRVEVSLPKGVQGEVETLWGEGGWTVDDDEKALVKVGIKALEIGIFKLKVQT